jgi:hypothetical protein
MADAKDHQCVENEYCYCKYGNCIRRGSVSTKFNEKEGRWEVYHGFMRHIALGKLPPGVQGTIVTATLPAGKEGEKVLNDILDGKPVPEEYVTQG